MKEGLYIMKQPESLIGKLTKKDIYSHKGVLLLPIFTILTYENIKKLIQHGIKLRPTDVVSIQSPELKQHPHDKMIDETVLEVREIFDEIRETGKVPLEDLRVNVVPIIHKIADETHVTNLLSSLQTKDDYTFRHNIAVSAIASLIGKWMGLNHKELLQLSTAALLHDIGKIYIPQEILNKPGKLTEQEYAIMKNHTIFGYEIIKNSVGTNHRQALVALQHHERMDGSGYPFGITKNKIDIFSRIVAVADVFHAMTSRRVYRNESPFYEVLIQLDKDRFGALDPLITRLFIENIMTSLIGNTVVLTDGSKGRILLIPRNNPVHPLIQVGENYIDLSKTSSIHIKQINQ